MRRQDGVCRFKIVYLIHKPRPLANAAGVRFKTPSGTERRHP